MTAGEVEALRPSGGDMDPAGLMEARRRQVAWRAVVRISLLLALWTGPVAASAQGSFSLGGGASFSNVSSDMIYGGGGTGVGFEFTFGYRFWSVSRLSMELLVAGNNATYWTMPVSSPSYPSDTASFSLLAWGLRLDLLDPAQSRWSPWIGVAPALASLTWKTYAHAEDAVTPLFSLGADVELGFGLMARARFSALRGRSGGGLTYQAASLGLVWEFLRPRHHRRPETWSGPARDQ